MIVAMTPVLLFIALLSPSYSNPHPHSSPRTYYYKPYKTKLSSPQYYYKSSPITHTKYSSVKSHQPKSSKYFIKNPVISRKPGTHSRGAKYWKKSSKSGSRTRVYTKSDAGDTPFSGTIFYRKHENIKGITKEQSISAASSFLKKMRTYIGSYRSNEGGDGQSSNVGESHVEKTVDGGAVYDVSGRGKAIKERPFFRKYEVLDTRFEDKEMNKKMNKTANNSHLHFSELSIHHPSFHEFHNPAPQFMDQDLEKIQQSSAQQTETTESYDVTITTPTDADTDTEVPYTTATPLTPTAATTILSTLATTTHTTSTSTTTTSRTIHSTTTSKPNPDKPQIYFSKFHNGGNYAVQRPGKPLTLAASKYSDDKPQSDNIDESINDQKINQADSTSTTEYVNVDTHEKLIETERNNDSEGVVAYLVSDSHNPGKEFLITKEALIESGVITNKVVSLTSYSGTGGGKVEIIGDKVFNITGAWYRGAGSGDWLVGARFPIGYYSDSVILAPLQGDQILVLPDQISMADISWLALYCRTCVEDKVVMQVYIPETFL